MKFLSIIIPRYEETEKDIFPLLSSISTQVGINFNDIEVIIANDGGSSKGALNDDFLSLFNMQIKQVSLKENFGPGVARQVGLDSAVGQYVMFCDADDCIHNVGVLGALIQEAEKTASDIISSSWLEELVIDGKYIYTTHDIESTWMHGKLLRRSFLTQNNIRFHDDLRVHEDSYILCIATALTDKRVHLPITSYVWKYGKDSITRRNNGIYTYDSIPEFVRALTMAFKQIEGLIPNDQMEYRIVQFILYIYFSIHRADWQAPEHEKYLLEVEKAFVTHIKPFLGYWKNISPENMAKIYTEERDKNFKGYVEKETIWEWMNRLELE